MFSLSELICSALSVSPPPGDRVGTCMFCNHPTSHGHLPKFSDTFLNANLLSGGDVVCPACWYVQKAAILGVPGSSGKRFRSNMWAASKEGMVLLKLASSIKEEQLIPSWWNQSIAWDGIRTPRDVLLSPPEPPFAIYITRTWKKSGWQSMMRLGGVNQSRDCYWAGFDYENILVDRIKFMCLLQFIDDLRARGVSKPELESGQLRTKTLQKLDYDIIIMNRLKELAGDPVWSLAVYVA